MRHLSLILFFVLASCVSRNPKFDQEFEEVRQIYEGQRVQTSCENKLEVKPNCGMISMQLEEEIRQIINQRCKPDKLNVAECNEIWTKMVEMRLRARYPYANMDAVMKTCLAYPLKCHLRGFDGLAVLEALTLLNHNEGIDRRISIAKQKSDDEAEADIRERRARASAALAAFGNGMSQQKPIQPYALPTNNTVNPPLAMPTYRQTNCNSRVIGNQLYTKCNSYGQ